MKNILEAIRNVKIRNPLQPRAIDRHFELLLAAEAGTEGTIFPQENKMQEQETDPVVAQVIQAAHNGEFAFLTGPPEQTGAVLKKLEQAVSTQPFDIIHLTPQLPDPDQPDNETTVFYYHTPGTDELQPFATVDPTGVELSDPGESLLDDYSSHENNLIFVPPPIEEVDPRIQIHQARLANELYHGRNGNNQDLRLLQVVVLFQGESHPLNYLNLPLTAPYHHLDLKPAA